MIIFWNLASSVKRMRQADVFVISVAKSGRTWLRVLLNKYYSLKQDQPFDLTFTDTRHEGSPNIFYTHEQWEHITKASPWDKLRGKYRIPASLLRERKVVLLFRDPRDITVSLYHHKTKRSQKSTRLETTPSEFLRHPLFGIERTISVLNFWRQRLASHPRCFWLGYEALRQDTPRVFSELLQFLEDTPPDPVLVQEAIAFADFRNMQKMERTNAFNDHVLRPRNVDDPDSYKVRKGKVGGFAEELDAPDVADANAAMQKLDSFFRGE